MDFNERYKKYKLEIFQYIFSSINSNAYVIGTFKIKNLPLAPGLKGRFLGSMLLI